MTATVGDAFPAASAAGEWLDRARRAAEAVAIPVLALVVSLALFAVFVAFAGANPLEVFELMYRGAFGTAFSWENTLQRAAPIILTALCTALPARVGLVVIGNEGALVAGGVVAAAAGLALQGLQAPLLLVGMAIAGMLAGGLWIALVGALRVYRGINETISSLLLAYVAIALMNHVVEGWMRDPTSLNKPSTAHIGEANMLGQIPGLDVHWGLVFGIVLCIAAWFLIERTTFGFGARMVGGNVRAARMAGLPIGRIMVIVCFLGGAAAGLAGMVEVAAVHGRANASLAVGYGYTGILVAFLARQNPLAIIPVAILLGGIEASGGLVQRRVELPDATMQVLQGIVFLVILASETLFGRFSIFRPRG